LNRFPKPETRNPKPETQLQQSEIASYNGMGKDRDAAPAA
jgi:hypothetical protein